MREMRKVAMWALLVSNFLLAPVEGFSSERPEETPLTSCAECVAENGEPTACLLLRHRELTMPRAGGAINLIVYVCIAGDFEGTVPVWVTIGEPSNASGVGLIAASKKQRSVTYELRTGVEQKAMVYRVATKPDNKYSGTVTYPVWLSGAEKWRPSIEDAITLNIKSSPVLVKVSTVP